MPDFAALRARLTELRPQSPQLARQLKGVDIAALQTPADLARLPLLRKSGLSTAQKDGPPFAGIAARAPGGFRRLFMSPGPIFEVEDHGDDVFGSSDLVGNDVGYRKNRLVDRYVHSVVKEEEMMQVADFIDTGLKARNNEAVLAKLRKEVTAFTARFPLP